ncbi:putative outer membrane protein [Flavobacterium sp. 9AF]|uniref:erythromycin esterase family protein n=1 Tax=Flavobacterium sp. 9AF TaxID=2653142 RepID=UPI0012F05F39|nr:erythromycin esterase family protein [Flavobacterium sp. 9AF]VXB16635.1 putative outer membrane protein [Flavobacterium sp. 9AF]
MRFLILIFASFFAFPQAKIDGKSHSIIDNSDYSFLETILKYKHLVLLGEQSHGDGATFNEKIKLIKYLHEKLGYNTIAFESGLYDNYKARQLVLNKEENSVIYNESIFSIWSDTQSFQELLIYIEERAKKNDTIKIVGFDCQEGVLFKNYFIDDLKTVFKNRNIKMKASLFEEIEKAFIYKDLEKIATNKTDSIAFYKNVHEIFGSFEKMNNLTLDEKIIKQVFTSSLTNVNFEIAQIQNQKIAVQNPRDKQMAQNLIFLAESYPNEKIIGWGASYHFAKEISNLEIDNLTEDYLSKQSDLEKKATGYSDYNDGEGKELLEGGIPMGKILKEYFKENIYTIAFSSFEGNYGMVNSILYPILTPPENSVEKQLSEYNIAFFEFDVQNKVPFYSSILGNMPIKGNWQTSFDALVFIKKSYPPVVRKYEESDFKKVKLPNYMIKGRIVDKNSNHVIPNAEIQLHDRITITKRDGTFEMLVPNTNEVAFLKVNAFEYASDSLQLNSNLKDYVFQLSKSKMGGIILDEVILNTNQKELSAKEIITKAQTNVNQNYYQKEFNQSFLYKSSIVKEGTEKIMDEAILKFYCSKGLNSSNNSDTKFYGKIERLKKTPSKSDKLRFSSSYGLFSLLNRDLITEKANALYRSGSYNYKNEGFETIKGKKTYKISFVNTSPGSHSTGFGYPAPKSSKGYIYIDCETFAVLQFEHCVEREPFDLKDNSGQNFAFIYKIIVTYQYSNGNYFLDELIMIDKNTVTNKKDPNYINVYFHVNSLKSDYIDVANLEIIKEPIKLNFGANTTFKEDVTFWKDKETLDNVIRTKDEYFCK